MRRLVTLVAAVASLAAYPDRARPSTTLDPQTRGLLEEEPDAQHFTAIVLSGTSGFDEAKALALAKFSVFGFANVLFTRAKSADIMRWASRAEVRAVDVVDENATDVFFRVMAHLQTVARYDDLGVLRPNVVNVSMGPVRSLVGKDASGEHAIRAAVDKIVDGHGIPVVMSAGNDGPGAGTINPWALDTDAIVVGATDASGTALFDPSSRFRPPAPGRPTFFVADGVDTVGPRAGCRPKSREEEADDARVDLARRVGAGEAPCWEVKSGTSFSAAAVTRMLCLVHQGLHAIRLMGDPATAGDGPTPLPVFVRAYVDFDFDRALKAFENRLADSRAHFGGVSVSYPGDLRRAYLDVALNSSLDLDLRYGPKAAVAILGAFAKAVPGRGPEDAGSGFLSFGNLAQGLGTMRVTDLVDVLGRRDPRSHGWSDAARRFGDPLVLPPEVLGPIVRYCESDDLILGLPVSDRR